MDTTDRYILGEVALKGLMDRKGIGSMLSDIKYDDPEIYDEILEEAGGAIAEHLGLSS